MIVGLLGALAQADLPSWVRYLDAVTPIDELFFRPVELPGGPVPARRPPAETRNLLTGRIDAQPDEADLYRLRAREAERALDMIAAERDWQAYAERVADPAEGQLALADFYARRLQAAEEVEALTAVGRALAPPEERFTPAQQTRSWQAFERIVRVVDEHLLPEETRDAAHQAWITRFPDEQAAYERYLDWLVAEERFNQAETLLADHAEAFPDATSFAVRARAQIERARSGDEAGAEIFDEAFEPLWPQPLVLEYLSLLEDAGSLRARLDEARAAVAADPENLQETAWLYHYYRRQGDDAAAGHALDQFRQAQSAWSSAELRALAELYGPLRRYNDVAICLHALYNLGTAGPEDREHALHRLIALLLGMPEQPLRLATGDLSFYEDIATLDPNPGFLNGLLSLALNTQGLDWSWNYQQNLADPYFRRARAAELLARFDDEFPESERRSTLRALLIEAYAVYGDNTGVIREGREFLSSFLASPARPGVALRVGEALARADQVEDELALYDAELERLAAEADNVPLGEDTVSEPAARRRPSGQPRSPDYARVLDRYISRLAALERTADAVALYAREIARNPDDPGLYERLAGFLDANGFGQRVEQIYRQAIGRFDEPSWHHKLARWYLRRNRKAEFTRLTREITEQFAGTALEEYFQRVVPGVGADEALYIQLNRYALERFPRNLTFVRNLLNAYRSPPVTDMAAWRALIRQYWFHADDLRVQYLQALTRDGDLERELDALLAQIPDAQAGRWQTVARQNPAAAQLYAEGEAWRAHYEDAAPAMLAVASAAPVDEPNADRAVSAHRSLAYQDPLNTDIAASLAGALANHRPGDRAALARIGDILADRGRFEVAADPWRRMAATEPGDPAAYLDAATVFWDYYDFDAALELLDEGRRRLGRPALYAYEAGAIHEGLDDPDAAVAEYLQGAIASEEPDYQAAQRLVTLSGREPYAETIEQATARLAAGRTPSTAALNLRTRILETQERDDDLAALLARIAADTESRALLEEVERIARRNRLGAVELAVVERRIELTNDPVERMRRRLELVRLHESQQAPQEAEQASAAVYRDHPLILGVVRARVDYLWRSERRAEAIKTLAEAAGQAYPGLGRELRFEAASKALEAESYDRARELLAVLLEAQPENSQYLAAMADSYAREGDDEALRAFYEEKIATLDDKATVAGLRRGLIPALDRLGDPAAAVDQYIELINAYPDDEALVREAARYASDHSRRDQLIDFYRQTTEQSPRDVRFHKVLAWAHAELEEFPPAVEALGRALDVRPDEVALYAERGRLRERLLRFEEAIEDYRKAYELTYESPSWMERIARLHARLGQVGEAREAVRLAVLEGRPERAAHYFEAARLLESWSDLSEAAALAEEGVRLAGEDLISQHSSGAGLYLRLMTRLRRYETAYPLARGSWTVAEDAWKVYPWQSAVAEMMQAAADYFTPEELERFREFVSGLRRDAAYEETMQALVPALRQAGLAEIEALQLDAVLEADPTDDQARAQLIEVESRRMNHASLGARLEENWRNHPDRPRQTHILLQAAEAYRSAGNDQAELEARRTARDGSERRLALELAADPNRLVTLAGGGDSLAARAVEYAVAQAGPDVARRAVEAFGAGKTPVWTRSHTALTGLYYGSDAAPFGEAFRALLEGGTIGERLGQTVDRDLALAGDRWFEHGSRFGHWLNVTGDGQTAEDYLPAEVEAAPGRASAYFRLGELYFEAGSLDAASAEFERALELAGEDPVAQERLARIAFRQGRRADAVAGWRAALDDFARRAEGGRFNEEYWREVPALIERLASENVLAEVRGGVDALLAAQLERFGIYRIEELLRPLIENASDPAAELSRALDLADQSRNPVEMLQNLAQADWLTLDQRLAASARAVERAREAWEAADPDGRYYEQNNYRETRVTRLELLLEAGRVADAEALLSGAEDEFHQALRYQRPTLPIRAAARSGRLEEALEALGDDSIDVLLDAARELRAEGFDPAANRLLEFFYERKIEDRILSPSYFLGLAELRFEADRDEDGLALVRRLLRVAEEPFEQHRVAAALLSRFELHAEAVSLLEERIRAAPWDFEARVKLGRERLELDAAAATDELALAARRPDTPYALRAEAAATLGVAGAEATNLGSTELDRLAAGPVDPGEAAGPGWFEARVRAAANASDAARADLLAGALGLRPDRNRLRLDLFLAERAADRPARAVAALAPALENTPLGYQLRRDDSIFSEQAPNIQVDRWAVERFLSEYGLASDERATLVRELATALENLGRLSGAGVVYQVARELGAATGPEVERLRAELERRAANARRRPVLREDLTQPNLVRPRLAAGGAE